MGANFRKEFVRWPSWVFRFIGLVNFAFVSVGLLFMGGSVFGVMTGRIANDHEAPYLLQAFWTMTAVNLILLVSLAVGSVRLLQLKPRGVAICSSVFAAEILYFILVAMLWFPFSAAFSKSIAGASGIGEMGIAPQVLSGYPLIALCGLYLAHKRLGALPPHKDLPIATD